MGPEQQHQQRGRQRRAEQHPPPRGPAGPARRPHRPHGERKHHAQGEVSAVARVQKHGRADGQQHGGHAAGQGAVQVSPQPHGQQCHGNRAGQHERQPGGQRRFAQHGHPRRGHAGRQRGHAQFGAQVRPQRAAAVVAQQIRAVPGGDAAETQQVAGVDGRVRLVVPKQVIGQVRHGQDREQQHGQEHRGRGPEASHGPVVARSPFHEWPVSAEQMRRILQRTGRGGNCQPSERRCAKDARHEGRQPISALRPIRSAVWRQPEVGVESQGGPTGLIGIAKTQRRRDAKGI